MKTINKLILVTIALLIAQTSTAQWCGTTMVADSLKAQDSIVFNRQKRAFNKLVQYYRYKNPGTHSIPNPPTGGQGITGIGCPKTKYIIPIVIHIVYKPSHSSIGTGSNISQAQIDEQINILNKNYRNAAQSPSPAVNTGIQFVLAQRDIAGNSSTGIIRHSSTYSSIKINEMNKLWTLNSMDTLYPASRYMNIWVVNEFLDHTGAPINVAGLAMYPTSKQQGIAIKYTRFGNYPVTGSPLTSFSRGNVLSHEVGHYLGVYHPFEGKCAGLDSTNCATQGDLCCDVPASSGSNRHCLSAVNTCTENYGGNPPDQTENYMDYTPDTCRNTFTENQTGIMHTTLEYKRYQLWEVDNINRIMGQGCVLSAKFTVTPFACAELADSIHLKAYTYTDSVTYHWQLYRNGTLYSQIRDTLHSHILKPTVGMYKVVLTMSNGTDSVQYSLDSAFAIDSCGSTLPSPKAHWYFGNHAGIRFTDKGVFRDIKVHRFDPDNLNSLSNNISMSDSAGGLLFYGGYQRKSPISIPDSLYIYNKNYQKLNQALKGPLGFKQPVTTFAVPDTSNLYYIFHLAKDTVSSAFSVFMSVLNPDSLNFMKRNVLLKNKYGDTIKNVGAISAVLTCNKKDYWLLLLKNGTTTTNDSVMVLLVTKDTIIHKHTFSLFHKIYNSTNNSNIVISPNGKYISMGLGIYKFNRSNGLISLRYINKHIKPLDVVYTACFSSDGTKLYRDEQLFLRTKYNWEIVQYDMSSSDTMIPHKLLQDELIGTESLQLGPDGKIYVSVFDAPFLSVINKPNELLSEDRSDECEYGYYDMVLSKNGQGGICNFGLPQFVFSSKKEDIPLAMLIRYKNCTDSIRFESNQSCGLNHQWIFGDGDTSYLEEPYHTYSQQGIYTVKLIVGLDTFNQELKLQVDERILGTSPIKTCDTTSIITLQVGGSQTNNFEFTWNSSNPFAVINNDFLATFKQSGTASIVIKDYKTNCKAYDTVQIVVLNDSNIISSTTNYPCTSLIINGSTIPDNPTTYQWYKSTNNISWTKLHNDTLKDLILIPLPLIPIWYKRHILSPLCNTESNTLKITKMIVNNAISIGKQPLFAGDTFYVQSTLAQVAIDSATYIWEYSLNDTLWQTHKTGYNFDTSNSLHFDSSINDNNIFIRKIIISNGCSDTSNKVILNNCIVNNISTINTKPCLTQSSLLLTGNNEQSYTFKWYYSLDSISWIDLTNAQQNYNINNFTDTTKWYRREVYFGNCKAFSDGLKIQPTRIENNIIAYTRQNCVLDDSIVVAGSVINLNNPLTSFKWERKTTPGVFGTTFGSINEHADFNCFSFYTGFRRIINSNGCSDTSNILSSREINNIIYAPSLTCASQIYHTIAGNSDSSYSYQWYYSLSNGPETKLVNDTIANLINVLFDAKQNYYLNYYFRYAKYGTCNIISNKVKLDFVQVYNNSILFDNDSNCFVGSNTVVTGDIATSNNGAIVSKWEYSLDSIVWHSLDTFSANINSLIQLNTFISKGKVYVRRIIRTTLNCTDTSNIVQSTENRVSIKTQPKKYYLCTNQPSITNGIAKFEITVNNPENLLVRYYWEVDWNGAGWQTIPSLNIFTDNKHSFQTSSYANMGTHMVRCKIATPCGYFYSDTVLIIFNSNTNTPSFSRYPIEDYFVKDGDTAILSGHSTQNVNYQWYKSTTQNWIGSFKLMDWEMDSVLTVSNFNICDPNPKNFYKLQVNNGCLEAKSPLCRVYGSQTEMYIRDYLNDAGREPYTIWTNKSFTHSPDMWVSHGYESKWRTSQPSHSYSNPQKVSITADTNWLWTKITNRGTDTTREAKLWLYWTLASTGEQWDVHWTANSRNKFFNILKNDSFDQGGKINATAITIPPIAPGEYFTDAYPWPKSEIPQPDWYSYSVFNPDPPNPGWDTITPFETGICFLARIEICDTFPFGMTYPEKKGTKKDFKDNVLNNNKIATNNTYLGKFGAGFKRRQARVMVRNISDTIDQIKVSIHCNNPAYFNGAKLLVRFDEDLWNYWLMNGQQGSGFVIIDTGLIQAINQDSIHIEGLLLDSAQWGTLSLEFEIDSFAQVNITGNDEIYIFDILQQSIYDTVPQGWVHAYLSAPTFMANGGEGEGEAGSVKKDSQPSGKGKLSLDEFEGKWQQQTFATIPMDIPPLQLKDKPFVKVYPNPNNGSFKIGILSDNSSTIALQLYDNNGKLVSALNPTIKGQVYEQLHYVNKNITEGDYYLNIQIDGKVFKVKIVVVK